MDRIELRLSKKLVLIRRQHAKWRTKLTIAQLLNSMLQGLQNLEDILCHHYIGGNNALFIPDLHSWKLEKLQGIPLNNGRNRLYQLYIYPLQTTTTRWIVYDRYTNGRGKGKKSTRRYHLNSVILRPSNDQEQSANLYFYQLSFDEGATYASPMDRTSQSYQQVLFASKYNISQLPTEDPPTLVRIYKFPSS